MTRTGSELVHLRKLARQMARERKETPTTVHLLAAAVRESEVARAVLRSRRLDEARILAGARAFDEVDGDPFGDSIREAKRLARRVTRPTARTFPSVRNGTRPAALDQPRAIHLVAALLSNRQFAACRALLQYGIDLPRLRTMATQVALGVLAPPRLASPIRQKAPNPIQAIAVSPQFGIRATKSSLIPSSDSRPRRPAVEVPLWPPPRPPAIEPKAAETSVVPVEVAPAAHSDEDAAAPASTGDTSVLLQYGRDLSLASSLGELDPVVGREREVNQVLDVLAKRNANCPVLVGPAGVGKTAVAEAVARALHEDGGRLIQLSLGELLSGTGARGSLAERMAEIVAAVIECENGSTVIFIDDFAEFSMGAGEEGLSELKKATAAGTLPLLAATTATDYRRLVEAEPVLARRLIAIEIAEPSEDEAVAIAESMAAKLSEHHQVTFDADATRQAVSWSVRYLPGRALPDKAVALLDLAGARTRRRGRDTVTEQEVAEVVAERTDVPIDRLMQTDRERMLGLEAALSERVVGHHEAASRIAAILRRNAAGLRGSRPVGSFLLLGPTGVGKTEMAKAIAEVLFFDRDAMTRLDMSEYGEPHSVARLIGAPPGYVGHEAGGLLTEAVKRRPYQVILLDEIEKAHPDVLQTFLQVFDEGRLTDGRGRTVSFANCTIILTSNLGAAALSQAMTSRRVGFGSGSIQTSAKDLQKVALAAARGALPPELYNRFDDVLFFRPLDRTDVRQISKRLLQDLVLRLKQRSLELKVEDGAYDLLLERGGYEPALGARPMRRAIERLIEAPLAELILAEALVEGGSVMVSRNGDEFEFAVTPKVIQAVG